MRMRALLSASLLAFAAVAAFTVPRTAAACGGCFVTESESTQVSGHRMVVSIAMARTTLWDQITYAGSPESFAWVLPIHGTVEVGLSSNSLFQVLDERTRVTVVSPPVCPNNCGPQASTSVGGTGGEVDYDTPVQVLVQEVVGPYEMVQLASSDPGALADWLSSHGYSVPPDIQPILDDHVAGGFNFLALKLVPGEDISAMRPVRVTFPGASFQLPLRMVAAGTGAVTPLRLWVIAEGRYEPTNFPSFQISGEDLVWDWDTSSSNYAALRTQKFKDSGGFAWLIDHSDDLSHQSLPYLLGQPEHLATYAGADGNDAEQNLEVEIEALQGALQPGEIVLTAMSAELSRKALENDLSLGASLDQSFVSSFLQAQSAVGTPSPCPPDPCGELPEDVPDFDDEAGRDPGGLPLPIRPKGPAGATPADPPAAAGCQVAVPGGGLGAALVGLAAALVAFARRRRAGRRLPGVGR